MIRHYASILHCDKNIYFVLCILSEPIDLNAYGWYAGKDTTERAAEKILNSRSKIGTFLVTDCNVLDIDYMLLVK